MPNRLSSERGSLFGPKAKILIVEDNDVDRKVIEKALGKYQLILSNNAEDGLNQAREEKPDLIVLDMNLPGMDGVEMCKVLKDEPDLKEVPVVFLTSEDNPTLMVEAFESDAENYLTKPINSTVLSSQVKAILEEQKQ